MDIEPDNRAVRARADLVTALVLLALGLAVVYLSWTMPRLEARRIHPATIPGLVPLILGAALVLCSGLLAWRSARLGVPGGWSGLLGLFRSREALRVGTVLALAFIFTLGLVGTLPFWAASMLFIFAFIALFELVLSGNEQKPKPLSSFVWAAVIAVVGGGGIYFVFERIFLVRLP